MFSNPARHGYGSDTKHTTNSTTHTTLTADSHQDPFSRLISSLDRPRFTKASIDGNDLLEDRHLEYQRGSGTTTTTSPTALHPSQQPVSYHDTVVLTVPESRSLQTTSTRSQAVSDRLRMELENVRHENALLATRYATLTTKLRQTSDRSVANEQQWLDEVETHKLNMDTATKKLLTSEKDKLELEQTKVELSELKTIVLNLKKESGAQVFVMNQRAQEIVALQRELAAEKELQHETRTTLSLQEQETSNFVYGIFFIYLFFYIFHHRCIFLRSTDLFFLRLTFLKK